jgi:hypothetical protein
MIRDEQCSSRIIYFDQDCFLRIPEYPLCQDTLRQFPPRN